MLHFDKNLLQQKGRERGSRGREVETRKRGREGDRKDATFPS